MTPATPLAWHRKLAAVTYGTSKQRKRPSVVVDQRVVGAVKAWLAGLRRAATEDALQTAAMMAAELWSSAS